MLSPAGTGCGSTATGGAGVASRIRGPGSPARSRNQSVARCPLAPEVYIRGQVSTHSQGASDAQGSRASGIRVMTGPGILCSLGVRVSPAGTGNPLPDPGAHSCPGYLLAAMGALSVRQVCHTRMYRIRDAGGLSRVRVCGHTGTGAPKVSSWGLYGNCLPARVASPVPGVCSRTGVSARRSARVTNR